MHAKKTDTDVLQQVKQHVRNGTYIVREHALMRQEQRSICLPDVLYVLVNGRHEQEKDIFDVKYQRWKYAIRGRTVNASDLRIIVAFHEKMAIITVIKLVGKL